MAHKPESHARAHLWLRAIRDYLLHVHRQTELVACKCFLLWLSTVSILSRVLQILETGTNIVSQMLSIIYSGLASDD